MSSDLPAAYAELLATVPPPVGSRIETSDVMYEDDGLEFEGFVAVDEAIDGTRPGVLVVHEWTGVGPNVRMRAEMLARLGYVAFAVDVYGRGVRPSGDDAAAEAGRYYRDLPLMRSRVQLGFEQLRSHPSVDPTRIAVMGYCFGGSASLEFARTGADLRGVVSFHGALIAHDPSDADAIRASVLVLAGAQDSVVTDLAVAAFEDDLRSAPTLDWQLTTYSGAPHGFTMPGPAYRPIADRRSWGALRDFFSEVFI